MSSSTKRNVVVIGLDDNESTDKKKQKYQCDKEEETPATITTEARLEAPRKRREEHWKELEAIRKLEEEYEEDPELEEEEEDNEYESFNYNDLHLAYLGEKSPD
ncbi:hypothetical protein Tco_0648726 [Tanacetum coccineum]